MHVVCQHGRMHRRRRCRFVVLAGRRCSPITVTRSFRTIIAASFGSLVADNHERLAIQATGLVTCTYMDTVAGRLQLADDAECSALFFGAAKRRTDTLDNPPRLARLPRRRARARKLTAANRHSLTLLVDG